MELSVTNVINIIYKNVIDLNVISVACLWPSDHLTSDPTDPDHMTLDPLITDQVANPHRCIRHCTSVLWTHRSHTRWGKRHRCAMYLSKELFEECWSPSMMKFEVLGRMTDVRAVNNQRQHRRLVNTTLQHSLDQSALNTQLDTVPTDLCWLSYYKQTLCVTHRPRPPGYGRTSKTSSLDVFKCR